MVLIIMTCITIHTHKIFTQNMKVEIILNWSIQDMNLPTQPGKEIFTTRNWTTSKLQQLSGLGNLD